MHLPTAVLRVLLIDDHPLVRVGVRHLLEQPGAVLRPVVVDEAGTLEDARRALAHGSFELVLLDLALGDQFALRALPELRERAGAARFIVLTSMPETLYAEQALRAGADGFLMKSELGSTLLEAVRTVLQGNVHLSPQQRDASLRRLSGRAVTPERPALSARELEVLRLVAAGRSTKEIAGELNRSVKTIETHKQNLKSKLGAESPAQLMRHGLAWFGAAS